ncbi:MAG: rhomboid family intramembrane serine protease [Betaproteobacteria bacterium]|nr:rhomboid family intramembrane serine protease [Betaproteobacteria bacterium]MDE2354434.1 rhomboid family intramembrane serine protease [Betaproteobacteria bacterium]
MTYALIACNLLVYLAMGLTYGVWDFTPDMLLRWGANAGDITLGLGQYYRLLTASFVHVTPAHILFNMVAFYQLGTIVERIVGARRVLALYLVSALAGSVLSVLFNPPFVVSAGASTAVLGFEGFFLAHLYQYRHVYPPGLMFQTLFWVALAILPTALNQALNVDLWGHVGGLAGGLVFAQLFGTPRRR